jgi:hypothetical protein
VKKLPFARNAYVCLFLPVLPKIIKALFLATVLISITYEKGQNPDSGVGRMIS